MSIHEATISWGRRTPDFTYATYSRDHAWVTGSGATIEASAAPEWKGDPRRVNPEEAFVAALSSCHMLTFLAVAARQGLVVDGYEDRAVGHLDRDAHGKLAMTRVTLRPNVVYGGERGPSPVEEIELHQQAHRGCFIASSVKTDITIEPVPRL